MIISNFFQNNFIEDDGVYILDQTDSYTENFGKQWETYRDTQLDSFNKNKISYDYLNDLTFRNLNSFKDKNVLEIGSGSGRFTEILSKYCKFCVSVDFSKAIYFNITKGNKNVVLIKSDFINLISNNKFDIVICRGVLQHTENPIKSILKLFDFIDNKGLVYFDIYQKPFLGKLNPKYIFWRPLLQFLFTYESFEKYLTKRIKTLIKFKKFLIKYVVFSKSISDVIIPIWYYIDEYPLNEDQLEKWAILDTLDGIFAKYDQPMSNNEVIELLKKSDLKLILNNKERNFFKVSKN